MYRLVPHSGTPPVAAEGLSLMWMQLGGGLHQLTWRLAGASRLLVPPHASRERADDLWRMTCFELFLRRGAGPAYYELNFSPSQRWAAYGFDAYRDGMHPIEIARTPLIEGAFEGDDYVLRVQVAGLPEGMTVAGASAVIDERSLPDPADDETADDDPPWQAVTSLWALNHPAPAPDFHHPGSFTLPLAPGGR